LLASGNFEVLITGDRNIFFQQNVPKLGIAVIVLEAESIRLVHTKPLMAKVLALLETIQAVKSIKSQPDSALNFHQ